MSKQTKGEAFPGLPATEVRPGVYLVDKPGRSTTEQKRLEELAGVLGDIVGELEVAGFRTKLRVTPAGESHPPSTKGSQT